MEFNQKLQELRKQKGFTQEELAEALFVSRTAISKWESGRGYPNIDSLKAIAKLFSVTIDDLLSNDELLTIAEEDNKEKEKQMHDLVFGLLDLSALLLFFLPFFGQKGSGKIQAVSMLTITDISPYLKIVYFSFVIAMVIMGALTLALQNCINTLWHRTKGKISLCLNVLCVFLFVVSLQPYAAVFLLLYLAIKALLLIKWH